MFAVMKRAGLNADVTTRENLPLRCVRPDENYLKAVRGTCGQGGVRI
jgi:hypothetical protein